MKRWSNKAHALDGGIPSLLDIERHWPAASDVRSGRQPRPRAVHREKLTALSPRSRISTWIIRR